MVHRDVFIIATKCEAINVDHRCRLGFNTVDGSLLTSMWQVKTFSSSAELSDVFVENLHDLHRVSNTSKSSPPPQSVSCGDGLLDVQV